MCCFMTVRKLWLLACFGLTACDAIGVKLPLTLPDFSPSTQSPAPVKTVSSNIPVQTVHTKSELYPAYTQAIDQPELSKPTKNKSTGTYTLNFDDADLAEVSKTILSDSLGLNYVLSPNVTGKVTLQTSKPLTKEELLPTLEMVLRMNNASLIKDEQLYRIEPNDTALYSSNITVAGNMAGYQTRIIPVRNVSVDEMYKVIKPLVQERTILQADNARNILLASGSSEDIQRVLDMVNTFDVDMLKGRSFALFSLVNADPDSVIKELEAVFNDKISDKEQGNNFFRFIAIEHLNAILAISHQAHYLKDIESWVFRLDKANTNATGGVNVYKVQHVDAVKLADTLNDIFNETGKSSENKSTDGNSIKVSNVGKVRIIPDAPNNSIIVVASPREYSVMRPIIEQLDVMPLQVLIDATIVEVDLKNDLKYGMQWSFESGNFRNLLTQVSSGDITKIGPVTGYSLFYSGGTAKAVLNALAEKSTVNVIASPSLMVLNNQEGFINVGDKVPIATSQSTNTNSVNVNQTGLLDTTQNVNAIVTNNIQMVDTGVTLKITPRVNAGGLVLMKIEQEANQAIKTTTSELNSPTIQQRKINSSIAVKNGETIVLGGLIREDASKGSSGMPLISDIPVLGALFGTQTQSSNKTELLILITPRVVQNEQNAREVTNEFKQKLTGVYQKAKP